MQINRRIASTLWFLAILSAQAAEQTAPVAPKPPARVIFLGNSLTRNNDLPATVRALARSLDPPDRLETLAIAVPGAYLHEHEAALTQSLSRPPRWDAVVLQGYSDEPLEANPKAAERFRGSVRRLDRIVHGAGARTVLFSTWGYRLAFGMTDKIAKAYGAMGTELGAQVVPVGLAFDRAESEARFVTLIERDGKHPTLAGTYLAACVFYASLYGRTPEGATYYGALRPDDAQLLQKIAWRTVREVAR